MKIMQSMSKRAVILSAALVLGSFSAFAANPDFTGDWQLNESKSNLGQFGRAAKTLKIQGDVTSLAIDRVSTNRNGEEVKTTEKWTTDDKEIESTGFNNSKKKTKVKWSDDGKTLNVKSSTAFEMNGQSMEIKSEEKWSLSDDGKTLTIESTTTSTRGTNTTKLVYDKK